MVSERVQREQSDQSERHSSVKPRQGSKADARSEGHAVRSLKRTLGNQAIQELHRRGELDAVLGGRLPAGARDREPGEPVGAERETWRSPSPVPDRPEAPIADDDAREVIQAEAEPADERTEGAEEPKTEAAPPTAAAAGEDAPGSPNTTPANGAIEEQGPANDAKPSPGRRRARPHRFNSDRAVERLMGHGVHPKLTLGRPNDAFEREADAVAEAVASGRPAPPVSLLPTRRQGGVPREEAEDDLDRATLDAREPEEEAEFVQPRPAGDGAGTTELSSTTAAIIRNPGIGQPLPRGVRSRIEPHLGARLDRVQVHAGPAAARAAADLGARAFTHGDHVFLGRGESPRDLQLMAHEVTHVVQQDAAAEGRQPASPAADVQRFVPNFVLEKLNDYARHIPGWTLFTVLIGYNPLLRSPVERTPMNLLEGLLGLVPFGTYIFDVLNEHGILQDAFDWVVVELDRLDLSLDRIHRTIEAAWDDVSLARGFSYNIEVVKRHFSALYDDVKRFASSLVSHIMGMIKEAVIGVAEDLLAENRAWELIKKVLGHDPLRDEEVEATPTEILEDFLLLIGAEEHLQQMRERDTVEETAKWIAAQIDRFTGLLGQLGGLIERAWEAIKPENLPNLMSNIRTLAEDVWGFLQDVWDFAYTVASEVLSRIKDALLGWLSSFAHHVPGFHLLTVIIEQNPFTGEEVPRTAENLIRGFISLLPGGAAVYDRLAESGTIAEAAARIEGAMAQLGISWEFVVGLFTDIWENLSIEDLIDPLGAFARIVDRFREPISRLFAFVNVVLRELFFVILNLMGFPSDLVGSIISNVMQTIEDIRNDPVSLLLNMLEAVKLGFENFFGKIHTYLGRGLVDWLFRGLRAANVKPPTDLSLGSVLEFVLGVLGVSAERLWEKLAARIGEENVNRIRGAVDRLSGIWTFVRDVQEQGVAAIWEYVKSQISGLWDTVLSAVREWVMERIVNRAIRWLMSLLDPTGVMAVINSFQAFFRAVQSAAEYLRDILAIIKGYVSTIANVARGAITAGAQMLEQGLANAIPVAIGFLANQFGLGNVGERIQEIVAGIRGVVDRALNWLMDRAERALQSVLGALGMGGEEEPDVVTEADEEIEPTDHTTVAQRVVEQLRQIDPVGAYAVVHERVVQQASELERYWSERLEPGIGLRVNVPPAEDQTDRDVDFRVVIAPNTLELTGSTPVEEADDSPATIWEEVAAATMEDYLNSFQNWRRPRPGVELGQTRAIPVRLADISVRRLQKRVRNFIEKSPASQAEKEAALEFVLDKINKAAASQEETTVYRRLRSAANRIQDLYGGREAFALDVEHLTEVAQHPEVFVRTRISRRYAAIASRIHRGTAQPGSAEEEIINMAASPREKRSVARLYAEQIVEQELGDVGETLDIDEPVEIELEIITQEEHMRITARRAAERRGT